MRKTVDFLGWMLVVITIFALVCTWLTTYNLSYVKYFNTYKVLQVSLFCTMLVWAIKMFRINTGRKRWAYSTICLIFALGTVFFMVYGEVW